MTVFTTELALVLIPSEFQIKEYKQMVGNIKSEVK